ncbi:MAG: glycoside hydrolase family 2 TIM barrel-domain containing protein [Bryobacterales bacterium]|nr:glycoside hydrolase family 2 TIM barrel-domain containing protein [Bryobacterales bacterium]
MRSRSFGVLRNLQSLLCALLLLLPLTSIAGAASVQVEKHGEGYRLLRDGKPYFIKGAGGSQKLDVLKEAGGNSIRTWRVEPETLDRAKEKDLTVLMGLSVARPRHGFDYGDKAAVAKQLEEARQMVLKYKDHPALLMWGVGNEVELDVTPADRPRLWAALEDLAKMVKQVDGKHPVLIILAGIGGGKLAELNKYCPSIDVLGINAYGGMMTVPEQLAKEGWTKPYAVTEFGPRGHWEVQKTPWGLPIEDNSTMKADFYLKAYQHTISGQPNCLGSYVFLWGQKQEKTHTWYGMFLPEGNRTGSVDALSYAWTGKWPSNRSPRIGAQAVTLKPADGKAGDAARIFAPGTKLQASFDVADPEGQPLTIRWDVRRDVSGVPQTGGDREDSTPPIEGAILETEGKQATIRLPDAPANYRIFVYAFDTSGSAATANVPVKVQ